ncbi:MAG: hypothetical protein ACKOWF_18060 [Chloroflexota bacterium]
MTETDPARWRWLSAAAMLALALLAAWRIGVFSPWVTVAGPAGPVVIPDALASVDHPFHIARAESLRRSWAVGEPLRWVGSHQQGYPAEFYPLGAQALTVAFWAAALGRLPIGWAHGAMTAAVFALPGLAWWLAARRDRMPGTVALLAFTLHIIVPGAWWHGGYTELVQWGLVTNVAGAAWSLLALVWLAGWAYGGARLDGALAISAGAAALLTNPRSSFALAAVFGGVLLAALLPPGPPAGTRVVIGRVLAAGAGIALVAAPQVLSLARFSRLYEFLHFGAYGSVAEWLASSVVAVWWPAALLCIAGAAAALLAPRLPESAFPSPPHVARAAACALGLYCLLTVAAIRWPGVVPQLEATRLMPFQRLLMLWLAALGAWAIARAALRRVPAGAGLAAAAPAALALAAAAFWLRPGSDPLPLPGPPDAPSRGLYAVVRTGDPSQTALETAVLAADSIAPPGSAVLVLGSRLSWHQQLWAPLWSERPFLYDNWLWFWRPDHDGPPGYAFESGHAYPRPELALDPAFLDAHGIGAVVASDDFSAAAAQRNWLRLVSGQGTAYSAWRVRDPAPLAFSRGGTAAREVRYGNGVITGVAALDGPVLAAQAWFPRWEGTASGSPLPLSRAANGTIETAPLLAGSGFALRYGADAIDWFGRRARLAGLAVVAGLLAGARRGPFTPARRAGYPPAGSEPAGGPSDARSRSRSTR